MCRNEFEELSKEEQKDLISKIRNITGAGIYEIKKTLRDSGCDYNLAIEELKEKALRRHR